jgi:hypothetical protein
VHQWVERFVVENYVPEEKKKRKRTQWADESRDGRGRAKQDARAEESEHVETTEHDGSRPIRH